MCGTLLNSAGWFADIPPNFTEIRGPERLIESYFLYGIAEQFPDIRQFLAAIF